MHAEAAAQRWAESWDRGWRARDADAIAALYTEAGKLVTLAGTTVLRFRPDGLVTDHVDYWMMDEGRIEPFDLR